MKKLKQLAEIFKGQDEVVIFCEQKVVDEISKELDSLPNSSEGSFKVTTNDVFGKTFVVNKMHIHFLSKERLTL